MLKINSKDRLVTDATLAKQIAREDRNEVLERLQTSIKGLNSKQAQERLERMTYPIKKNILNCIFYWMRL